METHHCVCKVCWESATQGTYKVQWNWCCRQGEGVQVEAKFCFLRVWWQVWGWSLGLGPFCQYLFCKFTYPLTLLFLKLQLLSALSLGLTKSYSIMSRVNTCISPDGANISNCIALFLLGFLCLCAFWEINTQRSDLCISDLHAVPAEQH